MAEAAARASRDTGPQPLPLGLVDPAGQVDLLEGDLAGEQRVGGPPDHAHAAVAELLLGEAATRLAPLVAIDRNATGKGLESAIGRRSTDSAR